MDWICKQEGIEADAEALSVLAQAGEGSIRDSLSALDQAIACCGAKLDAAEVRALLGAFSLDALSGVTDALATSDSNRMLALVDELERNGHNLQHFSRELSRYFRNLVVARIAGAETHARSRSHIRRFRAPEPPPGLHAAQRAPTTTRAKARWKLLLASRFATRRRMSSPSGRARAVM